MRNLCEGLRKCLIESDQDKKPFSRKTRSFVNQCAALSKTSAPSENT